jgi:SAM-dependent methyltransferase
VSRFPLPRASVVREEWILAHCRGKTVLHLGAADWPFNREWIRHGEWLHAKITEVAARCVGVELNGDAVAELAAKHGVSNLVAGDCERLAALTLEPADIIVAGELIEHLPNPGAMLSGVRPLLRPGGLLLVTTANAHCLRRTLLAVSGSESVHPDHIAFHSHRTLSHLAAMHGLVVAEQFNYALPAGPLVSWGSRLLERLATAVCPVWGEGIAHAYRLDA